jgi:hypothetical protein
MFQGAETHGGRRMVDSLGATSVSAAPLQCCRRSATGGDVSAQQVRLDQQARSSFNLPIRSLGVFRLGTSEHEHEQAARRR